MAAGRTLGLGRTGLSGRRIVLAATFALLAATALAVGSKQRLAWLAERRGPPTRFEHAPHKVVNCTTCHHNFRDRKLGSQGCIACHKAWGTTEQRRIDTVFHAFCTDCHRRRQAEGMKAGPVKSCAACHGAAGSSGQPSLMGAAAP